MMLMVEKLEQKTVELFRLFELPNYQELFNEGFINVKAERFKIYTDEYKKQVEDGFTKFEAIRRTASKFNVDRRTISEYVDYLS
jgi:hypothetical protein